MGISYKDSGVDVEAGYKAVDLMKKHVKSTYNKNVFGDLGSFGGFYSIKDEIDTEPMLVAGTDGVGTKLKYAFTLDKHDTVGIDCVAMCVNDIVCQGAKPLLFLDYLAVGKLYPELAEQLVKGVAEGCRQASCALIGGETAEMPGFYPVGEYDMAGFSVGIVDRKDVITGKEIKVGDKLIGIASSGIHSNGYSLVRKLFPTEREFLEKYDEELGACPADILLTPTKIYVKSMLELFKHVKVKGVAHITGGGFIENIPRILQKGLCAKIDRSSYEVPTIFKVMQKRADITDRQIYNTFNMGVGMVACVDKNDAEKTVEILNGLGEKAFVLGEIIEGEGVEL